MKASYTERGIILEHAEIDMAQSTLEAFGPENNQPLIDALQGVVDEQGYRQLMVSEETAQLLVTANREQGEYLRTQAAVSRYAAVIMTRGCLFMTKGRLRAANGLQAEADALYEPLADRKLETACQITQALRESINTQDIIDEVAPRTRRSA